MQPAPQPRLTEDERSNLVAFLDGEIGEEDAQKLEEKVARSVSVRKEVQALEKTWNMLDWLPRLEAAPDFASQTLTRIHSQQMRAERIEERVKWAAIVTGRVLGWVACVAAAVALGFAATRLAWPDPTRELVNDLDVVDHLESYRAIPDIEFLNNLASVGLFSDPPPPPPGDIQTDAPAAEQVVPQPAGPPPGEREAL
jgi:hypothetical protein